MKKILFHIFSILILYGCTEPFDIQTDDAEARIVIYGVLTDKLSSQEIRITSTAPYFSDNHNPAVSGAKVTVSSSEGKLFEYQEATESPGYYRAPVAWRAKSGESYTLQVEVDFDEDGIPDYYEASTKVSHTAYLDSISVRPIRIMGHENYAVNVYGQDSPLEEYYLFMIYVRDSLVNSKITRYVISDDIMFNGQYIDGLTIEYFDSMTEYENDSEERRKESVYLEVGDGVAVETCMITKGYYNFIIQCMNQKEGENPLFGGPPSNITSNISNGALGYFTAYPTSVRTTTVPAD